MSSAAQPGPLALVGSGEFLPQMAEIDRWLLAGRPPRAAFLATAAGLEGPETVSRWLALGVEHYRRLGVEPVPVPVIERADADDPDHAAAFEGCGLVYLSGGHPAYLAATLRGTAVWTAIERAWRAGAALAGCSAGAMALSAEAPSVRGDRPDEPGLALVAHVAVIPTSTGSRRGTPRWWPVAPRGQRPVAPWWASTRTPRWWAARSGGR
ncbi:MAG: Type 1 glutamine amidotransferase-like domain-containing protein [Acidimicrobiales bacterium]